MKKMWIYIFGFITGYNLIPILDSLQGLIEAKIQSKTVEYGKLIAAGNLEIDKMSRQDEEQSHPMGFVTNSTVVPHSTDDCAK